MEIQSHLTLQQSTLPYQPIKYVYTQTIGSVLQKFKEMVDPYTWSYEDILQPKILTNISKIQYYLFHIAPIYNWLRKVDSNILANYISLGQKGGNATSLNKPTFGQQKGQQFKKFDQKNFLSEIKHYISQWQIVKLSACAKVKIITTKIDQPPQQHNKNLTKLHYQEPEMRCTHLIKKQKFTSEYSLNNFTPTNIKLQCTKVYCEDCQDYLNVKSQIIKYPFAPYFQKYYGKEFVLNDNLSSRLVFQLVLVYGPQKVYIKTSGGVWYQISKQRHFIVSFDKIETKSGLLFIYQQLIASNKILRKAEPIKAKQNSQNKFQKLSENLSSDQSCQDFQQKTHNKLNQPKQLTPKSLLNNKSLIPPRTENSNSNHIQQQVKDDQPLQDMSKTPLPIVLNKKKTERKLFKEYKKTVEGLLPKPKQKDDYEKQYDKGKTKKIHKNRQQFRTANFFKLYTDIKNKNPQPVQTNYDRQEKEHFHDKQAKKDKKQKNTTYRQNQEDYNEVYQDKRSQRRNKGGSNKFGNKFNQDKHNYGKGDSHTGSSHSSKFSQNRKFNKSSYNNKGSYNKKRSN